MSFSAYSTTPSANLTINGINVAEGCPAGNLNNAFRQLMADGRELWDIVGAINVGGLMPKGGGDFTGNVTMSGGGVWHHANAAQSLAPVYTYPVGTALPSSPAEGTVVFFY